jgi:hypothetical protein
MKTMCVTAPYRARMTKDWCTKSVSVSHAVRIRMLLTFEEGMGVGCSSFQLDSNGSEQNNLHSRS